MNFLFTFCLLGLFSSLALAVVPPHVRAGAVPPVRRDSHTGSGSAPAPYVLVHLNYMGVNCTGPVVIYEVIVTSQFSNCSSIGDSQCRPSDPSGWRRDVCYNVSDGTLSTKTTARMHMRMIECGSEASATMEQRRE